MGPFFLGSLSTNVGNWFQNIAAAVVVYEITGSTFMVGLVSVMQFGAIILLSPWAGSLSDRIDRRKLLIVAQLIASVSVTLLTIWVWRVGIQGLPGPWPILATAGAIGIGISISSPTMQALIPSLVPPEDLQQTIALNSVSFNLARAVGPALGGLTLAAMGAAITFGINAATYLIFVGVLLIIHPRATERKKAPGGVRAGFRFVRSQRPLAVLLLVITAVSFGSDPVNTLLPALADELDGGPMLVGYLASAFGLGAGLMVPFTRRFQQHSGYAYSGIIGLTVLAIGLFLCGLAPTGAAALGALAVSGAGFLLALTSFTTLTHRLVPDEYRGRVMSFWTIAFLGSRPLAASLNGLLADLFNTRVALFTAGGLVLTAGMAYVVFLRKYPPPTPPGRLT